MYSLSRVSAKQKHAKNTKQKTPLSQLRKLKHRSLGEVRYPVLHGETLGAKLEMKSMSCLTGQPQPPWYSHSLPEAPAVEVLKGVARNSRIPSGRPIPESWLFVNTTWISVNTIWQIINAFPLPWSWRLGHLCVMFGNCRITSSVGTGPGEFCPGHPIWALGVTVSSVGAMRIVLEGKWGRMLRDLGENPGLHNSGAGESAAPPLDLYLPLPPTLDWEQIRGDGGLAFGRPKERGHPKSALSMSGIWDGQFQHKRGKLSKM